VGEAAALRSALRQAVDGALTILLAPACAACKAPLDEPTRGPICGRCWSAVIPITPPCCRTCGDPLPSWRIISVAESRCPRCRRKPPLVTLARAVGPYQGSLRAIVHALKYGGRFSLARPLAARMQACGEEVLSGADLVVPVPLHRSRQRQRGFNQAVEIARHLGLPMQEALRRTRRTASQADLPASRRHANVRDAFAPARHASISRCVVVLVDDVSTTGATLDACARVLLAAGAREVRALTVARAVTRTP
jgi:ComF family protein